MACAAAIFALLACAAAAPTPAMKKPLCVQVREPFFSLSCIEVPQCRCGAFVHAGSGPAYQTMTDEPSRSMRHPVVGTAPKTSTRGEHSKSPRQFAVFFPGKISYSLTNTNLAAAIDKANEAKHKIKAMTICADSYFLLHDNGYACRGEAKMSDLVSGLSASQLHQIKCVAISTTGSFVILFFNSGSSASAPRPLVEKLTALENAKTHIQWVTFTPNGGWLILTGTRGQGYSGSAAPKEILGRLDQLVQAGHCVKSVHVDANSNWVIVHSAGVSHSIFSPSALKDKLQGDIRLVAFG